MALARVKVRRTLREIDVRVPLDALGGPDRVLSGARTYLRDIPLDWASWRVLEVGKELVAPGSDGPVSGTP
jgi:hypothetical protein